MPAQMSAPKMPPEVFAASFDCFFIQAQPGQLTLFRVTLPNGQLVDCRLDPNALMTISRMFESATHAMMAQPPQVQQPAAETVKDGGQVDEAPTATADGGTIEKPSNSTIN